MLFKPRLQSLLYPHGDFYTVECCRCHGDHRRPTVPRKRYLGDSLHGDDAELLAALFSVVNLFKTNPGSSSPFHFSFLTF